MSAKNVPEHIDLHEMSRLVGVPHRAIQRWAKQDCGIPHVGERHMLMFPRAEAFAWLAKNKPGLFAEMKIRGVV
jgi:hypothetical protein